MSIESNVEWKPNTAEQKELAAKWLGKRAADREELDDVFAMVGVEPPC